MAGVETYLKETRSPARTLVLSIVDTVSSVAVDAGNTGQTHILRAGLELGIITATGEYCEYDADGTDDGRRVCAGILLHDLDLRDGDPTASSTDHAGVIMVLGQAVASECIGHDAGAVTDLVGKIWF